MPSTTLLASKLRVDFPELTFMPNTEFRWSSVEKTIFYDEDSADAASLLHELAHAVLAHTAYARDIELLEMERSAWEHAIRILAPTYNVAIAEDEAEGALDTYRDWLHARSICPGCHATGLQVKKSEYKCIVCITKWRVNDARMCALRRYKLKQ